MKKIFITVAISLIIFTVKSQEIQILKDYPGKIQYSFNPITSVKAYNPPLSNREELLVKVKIESVKRFLQTNPLLKEPKGFEMIVNANITGNGNSASCPVRSVMKAALYPWFMKDGKTDFKCDSCAKVLSLYFNQPEKIFNGLAVKGGDDLKDTSGAIINLEPLKVAEQNGCAVYNNGIVIIQKPGRTLWKPVSVAEYNDAIIRKLMAQLKEHPEQTAEINISIAKINDETASYTREQLNSPAYECSASGACPVKESDSSRAIVKLNPEYFDTKVPRSSIQLIILESDLAGNSKGGNPYYLNSMSTYESRKLVEILKAMNYAGFSSFLN